VGQGVSGVTSRVRVCEGLEGKETPGGFAQGLQIVLNSFHFINNLLLWSHSEGSETTLDHFFSDSDLTLFELNFYRHTSSKALLYQTNTSPWTNPDPFENPLKNPWPFIRVGVCWGSQNLYLDPDPHDPYSWPLGVAQPLHITTGHRWGDQGQW
jgi:hypothetical protein